MIIDPNNWRLTEHKGFSCWYLHVLVDGRQLTVTKAGFQRKNEALCIASALGCDLRGEQITAPGDDNYLRMLLRTVLSELRDARVLELSRRDPSVAAHDQISRIMGESEFEPLARLAGATTEPEPGAGSMDV